MVDSNTVAIIVIVIVLLIFLVAGLIFFGFISSPFVIPNTIQQRRTNLCVSTNTNVQDEQYPATLQTCGDTSFNQTFSYESSNKTFTTTINGRQFCLDVRGNNSAEGTQVGIFPCETPIPQNEQFDINSDGTISATIGGNNKRCIANSGGNLVSNTCNASDNSQQFFFNTSSFSI